MKKKTNLTPLFIIGGILIFLALGSSLLYFGITKGEIAGGATIFSIDTVSVGGVDKDTQWVIALSMNQGAERVVGTITPEDIAKYNIQSFPASSFKIEFDLQNTRCNYDVEKSGKVIGEIFNAQIDEQCLGIPCPYDYVDINDVIMKCKVQGKANCDRIISLDKLGFGDKTEWCSWMPEESNIAKPGECQNLAIAANNVQCRQHSPYPEGCNICNSAASCKANPLVSQSALVMNWVPLGVGYSGDLCCFNTGLTSGGVATDNGDWNVQSMGILPNYDVLNIKTTPMVSYIGKIKVTLDSGKIYEANITEKDTIVSLGELGTVKWAGNLVGTQFCPQPAIDTGLLRKVGTNEYKSVSAGAGSNYQSYLDVLNQLTRTDADHYTYTLVTPTKVTAIDPAVGGDVLYTSYTKLNSLQKSINSESKSTNCAFDINSNTYKCTTDTPVIFPLLKLTIKASAVGIIVPQGTPKILGISKTKSEALIGNLTGVSFNPNQLNKIYVGIKNIGEEDDSFDVSFNCPFPVSQQSARVSIASMDTGIAEVTVAGDGLIQKCQVRANSVSYPSNRDEMNTNLIINPSCDQYGIKSEDMMFTEFGCIALTAIPSVPCKNNEFWLSQLKKCIPKDNIKTGEQKLAILEEVEKTDCTVQCSGNKECVGACLDMGNVKPVCTGYGLMMSLNDYLCDYENQPNLIVPTQKNDRIWFDTPVCNYVCRYGLTGTNCAEVTTATKFSYSNRPASAKVVKSSTKCESCFDGIKNQNEEGIDCGGICESKYGKDKKCGKLRAPENCFNNLVDGDEECTTTDCQVKYGRNIPDCGGSCDFKCQAVAPIPEPTPIPVKTTPIFIYVIIGVLSLLAIIVVTIILAKMKRR